MTTYTRVDIPPPPGQVAKLPYKFHITNVGDRQRFHDDLHHGTSCTSNYRPGQAPTHSELLALIEELSTEKPYYVLRVPIARAQEIWYWLDSKRLWSRNHEGIRDMHNALRTADDDNF